MTVDFFISYAEDGAEWAEWIGWQLENDGYTVRLAAWDHQLAGGNTVLARDRDLRIAKRLIAVVSPRYPLSPDSAAEWTSFVRNDPAGEQLTIIPVEVARVERSALLGNLTPVVLHGLSEVQAAARLKRAVTQARLKPSRQPGYPGRRAPGFPRFASTSQIRSDTKFLLTLLAIDLIYGLASATLYQGDRGSSDLWRALAALGLFAFTSAAAKRWFKRRF
ncbi:toll/interleukin-1 receptor domain-containing protein [Streptomyces kaempferi]|uniref:Toll/interleukin-1 receptor domain-containing protein n=1 Tax=Streptomyces kaempferi TaxID=333725 RepID=A0ABW3XXL2_9ACTN